MMSKEQAHKTRSRVTKIMRQPARQSIGLPNGYAELLTDLKARIRAAQVGATLSANRELILLYWEFGRRIVEQQERTGWGANVIERLARDIQREFPGLKGFSPRNVWRMRAFYLAYRQSQKRMVPPSHKGNAEKLPQPVAEIERAKLPPPVAVLPWAHNVILMEKIRDLKERLWYAQQTVEKGWSRSILVLQIENELYHRQGKAVTNFPRTLPQPQSDLAQQTLKDPYIFDFLTFDASARERRLEESLLSHIQRFLVELGMGFAFVGRQVHFEVGGEDFYLDLLFYHLRLRCFVVIELKAGDFRPEYVGKMNFYLSAVDDRLRHAEDKPSIGLILCKTQDRLIVEYALRDVRKPVGVAEWKTRIVKSLPKDLKGRLPSIEEIEQELGYGKQGDSVGEQ